MADLIRLLPDAIANQIAAGEVVQRPASVVKELLENAIDAGASDVKVIVKDAGKALIQVIDNGCGMSETDARMCFERHATSKIREAKDLFAIRTMGFRGEAMSSIGAVAQVELRTRTRNEEIATRVRVEGGHFKSQEPCQSQAGTHISVKNLFYNVPARRNFLKSNQAEMRHIIDEFQRVAVANSDIAFSLHHNDTEIFHLMAGNLRQRVVAVFGQKSNKNLVPVEEETDVVKVTGYVGKPEFARKTRGDQLIFVNERSIKSNYLNHAITSAFDELLADGMYPFYVIFIDIDPSRIDINVHPTKQEIKFDDERLVYNYLKVAVKHALGRFSVMPAIDFEQDVNFGKNPSHLRPESGMGQPFSRPSGHGNDHRHSLQQWEQLYKGLDEGGMEDSAAQNRPMTLSSGVGTSSPAGSEPEEIVPVAPYQLHAAYIVSPIKSGFLLVDQQAAHERILYERYLEMLRNQQRSIQQELFPRKVELSAGDSEVLRGLLPQMNMLGFDVQEFGANGFVIHGVPSDLEPGQNEVAIIEQLLEQFRENVSFDLNNDERLAAAMAKSASIRRGRKLDQMEMQELIDKLFACEMPFSSPSGRKCVVKFDLEEIDKRFLI